MNERYKFRAWDYVNKIMIYDEYPGEVFALLEQGRKLIIMQSTGHYDDKKKEIYESDLIARRKYKDGINDDAYTVLVAEYRNFTVPTGRSVTSGIYYRTIDKTVSNSTDMYLWGEIVGNIHESNMRKWQGINNWRIK